MSPSPSTSTKGGYREEDDVPLRPPSRNWPIPSIVDDEPLPPPREWEEDIVISGISGRYPESKNIDEFWQKLTSGVELISCSDIRWPIGKSHFTYFLFLSLSLSLSLPVPFLVWQSGWHLLFISFWLSSWPGCGCRFLILLRSLLLSCIFVSL